MITDPLFLKAIADLKKLKPSNYAVREIDLYNSGKDAIQQEIRFIGNVLQVLSLPKITDVYIQFNELSNPLIKLEEGTLFFNFFRFFLTYKHTIRLDINNEQYLLKLLVGKDLISVQYPAAIKNTSHVLINNETYSVPEGAASPGYVPLFYKCADPNDARIRIPKGYTQLRALITSEASNPRKFRVYQGGRFLFYYDELELPAWLGEATLLLDLVGETIKFLIYQEALAPSFDVDMFATLWSI